MQGRGLCSSSRVDHPSETMWVYHHDEKMFRRMQPHKSGSHQRFRREVEWTPRVVVDRLLRRTLALIVGRPEQSTTVNGMGLKWSDDLHRLVRNELEIRAEHVMPSADFVDRAFQRRDFQTSGQTQDLRHVVTPNDSDETASRNHSRCCPNDSGAGPVSTLRDISRGGARHVCWPILRFRHRSFVSQCLPEAGVWCVRSTRTLTHAVPPAAMPPDAGRPVSPQVRLRTPNGLRKISAMRSYRQSFLKAAEQLLVFGRKALFLPRCAVPPSL